MPQRTPVVVLGAGIVGSLIARDLASDPGLAVTSADVSARALERLRARAPVETVQADLSAPAEAVRVADPASLVVGALPGRFGYRTLEALIRAGKTVCDVSFMPEDAWRLDPLARERGVTVLTDFGVAPGVSHVLVGYASVRLDRIDSVEIYVGGLPRRPEGPFRYKAPFSPADVIEEYVRPARIVEGGERVERPALSGLERIAFPATGELEAFYTDGLRSLLETIEAERMIEKTLRYPGHAALMEAFREAGFFGEEAVEVSGVKVRPLDLASKLLFEQWAYRDGEEDLTVMRVVVRGEKDGTPSTFGWDLFDTFDAESRTLSMARTTGLPTAAAARMLLRGDFDEPGVHPPERVGMRPGLTETLLAELAGKGIRIEETNRS